VLIVNDDGAVVSCVGSSSFKVVHVNEESKLKVCYSHKLPEDHTVLDCAFTAHGRIAVLMSHGGGDRLKIMSYEPSDGCNMLDDEDSIEAMNETLKDVTYVPGSQSESFGGYFKQVIGEMSKYSAFFKTIEEVANKPAVDASAAAASPAASRDDEEVAATASPEKKRIKLDEKAEAAEQEAA